MWSSFSAHSRPDPAYFFIWRGFNPLLLSYTFPQSDAWQYPFHGFGIAVKEEDRS